MAKFQIAGNIASAKIHTATGVIVFEGGIYDTDNPEEIALLEANPLVGPFMGEASVEESIEVFKVPKKWTANRIYKEADDRGIILPADITDRDALALSLEEAIAKAQG